MYLHFKYKSIQNRTDVHFKSFWRHRTIPRMNSATVRTTFLASVWPAVCSKTDKDNEGQRQIEQSYSYKSLLQLCKRSTHLERQVYFCKQAELRIARWQTQTMCYNFFTQTIWRILRTPTNYHITSPDWENAIRK